MKKRILTLISAFILSINFICSMSLNVYASDDLSGFDSWSLTEKMNYWAYNASQIYFGAVGFAHGNSVALDLFLESEYDALLLEDCTYEEWICARMGVQQNTTTGEYELVLDDELVDLMKQACDKYISEECGWYEADTIDYRDIPGSYFQSKGLYDAFIGYCTQNIKATDKVFYIYNFNSCDTITDEDGNYVYNYYTNATKAYENVEFYVGGAYTYSAVDWKTLSPEPAQIYADGSVKSLEGSVYSSILENWKFWNGTRYLTIPITDGVRTVRIYKTLEDLKNYSAGQRPYYATSDFYNYDSSQDNSVTLTGSDLSNGSVYGDVYNYIINNYDNPDGLTEDELRDILDDYFNNSGGGSGSSGNDSGSGSGSSGSGFLGFLDGLGSLGDAILGILGKLIEYIGKAIDLIVNGLTDIIDKIPKNVTNLIASMFPFLPEEFFTAIELALILGVVCIVIKIFK